MIIGLNFNKRKQYVFWNLGGIKIFFNYSWGNGKQNKAKALYVPIMVDMSGMEFELWHNVPRISAKDFTMPFSCN